VVINVQTVREGLVRHAWSEPQLVELERQLAAINLLADYKIAVRGERAFIVSSIDWVRRNPSEARKLSDDYGGAEATVMPSGWLFQNMVTSSQVHQRFSLTSVDEHAHRVFPEKSEGYMEEIMNMRGPFTVLARAWLPAVGKATQRSASGQFYTDAARIACALERFRLAEGKYPEALTALSPRFIDAIPNDVIGGKPLHYRTTTDGYVLYSIGWNQADDGGEVAWKRESRTTVDPEKGDWVGGFP